MSKIFYITTPIFYPNDRLHLGHAYAMVIADVIARYKRGQNWQVYLQTGSDDHGEKIEKKAALLGLTPQQLVDKNVSLFHELWKELSVSEHFFYRTSSPNHQSKVQKVFTKLLNKGDIYLGQYQGKYCVACEDYVSDSKVVAGNLCPAPNCQTELRTINEPAYFLQISKYHSQLVEYYQKNPNFLLPIRAKKELFSNFLNETIPDLCITRRDVKWGISVPNNEEFVIYVWFEALLNYLNSETGEKAFVDPSIEIIHLIGKEITRFHALYWPIILFALNKRLPTKILVHGWLTTPQGKMSKSKGNVIDPLELLKKYPKELLRTYFIAKINFLQDGICSEDLLKSFYQDFFVNNLSNLVSRVNKMIQLYNEGVIPMFEISRELEVYWQECKFVVEEFQKNMNQYELTNAFNQIQSLIDSSNKLISALTPWKLFKEKNFSLLNQILNHLANRIKIVAFLLNCIAPETSESILGTFNHKKTSWDNILDFSYLDKIKVKPLTKHLYEPIT